MIVYIFRILTGSKRDDDFTTDDYYYMYIKSRNITHINIITYLGLKIFTEWCLIFFLFNYLPFTDHSQLRGSKVIEIAIVNQLESLG